jgi:hypothetical protein
VTLITANHEHADPSGYQTDPSAAPLVMACAHSASATADHHRHRDNCRAVSFDRFAEHSLHTEMLAQPVEEVFGVHGFILARLSPGGCGGR